MQCDAEKSVRPLKLSVNIMQSNGAAVAILGLCRVPWALNSGTKVIRGMLYGAQVHILQWALQRYVQLNLDRASSKEWNKLYRYKRVSLWARCMSKVKVKYFKTKYRPADILLNFDVRRSVHHHMIQMIQPTRCNSFTSLLLDVYVWFNVFRASHLPSSGAYNCTRSLWLNRWRAAAAALLVMVCRTTTNDAPAAALQRLNQRLLVQLYAPDDGRWDAQNKLSHT